VYPIIAESCAEVMPFPLPSGENGTLSEAAIPEIIKRLEGADSCLVGPGLQNTPAVGKTVAAVLENAHVPVVLDADGINVLAGNIDILKSASNVVLTPHEGEFARLGGSVEDGRVAGAFALAERTGAAVVLKGHSTVTAFPDGDVFVNTTGNAGMACGGSGDVLAGMTAALAARFGLKKAVPSAVWLHGRAGDLVAEGLGEDFMKPTDVIDVLADVLHETY